MLLRIDIFFESLFFLHLLFSLVRLLIHLLCRIQSNDKSVVKYFDIDEHLHNEIFGNSSKRVLSVIKIETEWMRIFKEGANIWLVTNRWTWKLMCALAFFMWALFFLCAVFCVRWNYLTLNSSRNFKDELFLRITLVWMAPCITYVWLWTIH